jgi:hypothetical protein
MSEAFINGDYITFVNYIYPPILNSMGGSTKMIESLKKSMSGMNTQGAAISEITFDQPSKIIISGKELQSTIAQRMEIKLVEGRIVNTSTLIAISTDNGNNWTFIDTSNKDLTTLRKALPNLSAAISIPLQQSPVRYN